MAFRHVIIVFVKHKLLALLVDGIIGEMHADIVNIIFIGGHIGLSCEASKPLMIDKQFQRINTGHEDIDSEIEF